MTITMQHDLQSVSLHGMRVHNLTMNQTIEEIGRFIETRSPHHVVTLDASMCVTAQTDTALFNIVQNSELVTPDSAGVLWACRYLGTPLTERVSGVEIVERLCASSGDRGWRLFFFGAAPGVAEEAQATMEARYPGCRIVGARNGFFGPEDDADIVRQIRDSRPDVLCVALGIPRQELWIDEHRNLLDVPVMIGVGGSFDVFSGRVKRAPGWMQKLSLEWLYRLYSNPRKISKVLTLPRFVWMTIRGK